jgi:outer membrane protein assembly factor BamB
MNLTATFRRREQRLRATALGWLVAAILSGGISSSSARTLPAADWLQFRGNNADGLAVVEGPAKLDRTAWAAALPGRGISGPIVVKDRVYVTASSGHDQERLHVLAFAAADGKLEWERQFWATGRTQCHPKMAVASSNPASDGERVVAFYSTNDLACLDRDGKLLWYRGLTYEHPNATNSLGMASSPVIAAETVIVQVESGDDSFAMGLDVTNGQTRWKLDRPHSENWTSPIILRGANRDQDIVVLQGSNGLTGIVPKTGEEVWTYRDGASNVSSSAAGDKTIFVASHGVTALSAWPLQAVPKQLWRVAQFAPGYASLACADGRVYSVTGAPVLIAADAQSGKVAWRLRLTGTLYSSPIVGGGGRRMYCFNDAGLGQVVTLAKERGQISSQRDFKESILCTPALADKALYVRSDQHLWKIAD